ncbi:MAG: DNA translocase FtsK [Exilispira sp.]
MNRLKIKILHYFLAFFSTILIFFLYIIQNEVIVALGIFPWLAIEVIWFLVLLFDTALDRKALNLLFSILFCFTISLPLLEILFFGSNFFSINKNIVYLFESETAFFILYMLLEIFFILYLLISIIYYLDLDGKVSNIKDIFIGKENIGKENKGSSFDFEENEKEKLNKNKRELNVLKLNIPEINISPYIEEHDSVYKESNVQKMDNINSKIYDKNSETNNGEKDNIDAKIYANNVEINNGKKDNIQKVTENKRNLEYEEKVKNENIKIEERIINFDENQENEKFFNIRENNRIEDFLPETTHIHFEDKEQDKKVIEEKGEIILKTLKDFGIESKLLNYIKGPVVTRFELEIDERVNLGKIINLEKNITYNLSAEKIRILAPIPGKKAVGIEIPNEIKQIVYFTDLAKSDEFKNSNMHLPFILGKDIEGKTIVTDISKSPHLLIAGRTGSGKSVCINTLIASLVVANSPEKVRLILIDPKRVELSLYNELPHLLTDEIIIYPEDASAALKWLVSEMESRYSLLKENGSRSIEDYNQIMIEKLPYLVLIIDEFYALMQTAQKIIEDSLIHLSAMARAVGIHLIFATQRPSAEVVTGVIKSNLPSRIAFQTFSKTDSRIILDTSGAESLLGNGDMLFSFAGLPPVRIQGAFISTNEVRELVKKICQNYKTERKSINELFAQVKKEDNLENDDFSGDDPLYPEAVEIVKRERKVSSSYLQRRLKIGYNRAARIVEQMEEEGLISPLIDGKKREIYI